MEYKSWLAAVGFDDSVARLHSRVVNSGAYPIATVEATDVDGIRREFQRSIDEYIASCREDGVEPTKPFSGTLNLRLGPDLHQRAALSATAQGVSLNSWDQAGGGGEGVAVIVPARERRDHRRPPQHVTAPRHSLSQLHARAPKPGSKLIGAPRLARRSCP